jgi:hypothetical protein
MRLGTYLRSIAFGLVAAALLNSCAVHGTVGRADLLAEPTTTRRFDHFTRPPGQGVRSYTTTDNVTHEFEGNAWVEGDSMVFDRNKARHRVALADLASIDAEELDAGRTLFLTIGLAAIAFGAWVLIGLSSME